MATITQLWQESKTTFENKTLSQILSFAGDGKLKDGNSTSKEFRDLLKQVPSDYINQYSNYCLTDKFEDSGLALQDLINQIGERLGFEVAYGLYRGKSNDIGFDGIWTSKEGHSLVIEVKTTDAYRINLDTIAEYRNKLIERQQVSQKSSSILIVVGRQDTGDLEAQIRGSRHAWDIRLISTDSLINLLSIKEGLNDNKTIQQINELLKPREYTRIDRLIELIFIATKDVQIEEVDDVDIEEKLDTVERLTPVDFNHECVLKIQSKLNTTLIKQGKISYSDKQKNIGLTCAVSKSYKRSEGEIFWYAFHPHQKDFLQDFSKAYVAYGCGSPNDIILLPFEFLLPLLPHMSITQKENRTYWHIKIFKKGKKFFLREHKLDREIEITKYKV